MNEKTKKIISSIGYYTADLLSNILVNNIFKRKTLEIKAKTTDYNLK